MGAFSIWHWLIVLVVVLLLFGGSGKISTLMGDLAKGIRSFKKGLSEDDEPAVTAEEKKAIEGGKSSQAQAQASTREKTGTDS